MPRRYERSLMLLKTNKFKLNKMDWGVICCIFIAIIVAIKGNTAVSARTVSLRNLLDFVKRRSLFSDDEILGVPRYPEHLPRAERILPGHTLLKPSFGMLKSAVKFPHRDIQSVYGNVDNIGIAYGNKNERVRYTDFRKNNNLAATIIGAIENIQMKKNAKAPVVVIEIDPSHLRAEDILEPDVNSIITENENNASEIVDDVAPVSSDENVQNHRRTRKIKSAFRHRQSSESTESSGLSLSSASSDYEKNAGNPYTLHKDKYKQNWLWNHKMDGDHMNVNPYAPIFSNYGPSGTALFFGRKWWYFNQDDYMPLE